MILNLLKRIRRLSSIERFSNTPHIKRDTVAEHSFYTAILSMLFADLENERVANELKVEGKKRKDQPYDISKVLIKAILHDFEESLTGDILYPLKHESKKIIKDGLKDLIRDYVADEAFSELPNNLNEKYINDWENSKDNSKEGRLIKAVDKFDIVLYGLTELELGNRSLMPIVTKAKSILRRDYSDIKTIILVLEEIENYQTFFRTGLAYEENEVEYLINVLETGRQIIVGGER